MTWRTVGVLAALATGAILTFGSPAFAGEGTDYSGGAFLGIVLAAVFVGIMAYSYGWDRRNKGLSKWSKKQFVKLLLLILVALSPLMVDAETITWTNPAKYSDNTAIAAADQTRITNYLRFRGPGATTYTYFGETRGGKTSWTGTLPVGEGVAASYTVSAALIGIDNVERDSVQSAGVSYTRPFVARVPGAPSQPIIEP